MRPAIVTSLLLLTACAGVPDRDPAVDLRTLDEGQPMPVEALATASVEDDDNLVSSLDDPDPDRHLAARTRLTWVGARGTDALLAALVTDRAAGVPPSLGRNFPRSDAGAEAALEMLMRTITGPESSGADALRWKLAGIVRAPKSAKLPVSLRLKALTWLAGIDTEYEVPTFIALTHAPERPLRWRAAAHLLTRLQWLSATHIAALPKALPDADPELRADLVAFLTDLAAALSSRGASGHTDHPRLLLANDADSARQLADLWRTWTETELDPLLARWRAARAAPARTG